VDRLRKTFAFISLIVACLLLLTAWVLSSVQINAFDLGFYTDQYTKLGLSSYSRLSQTDYSNAMKDLLDYTSGSKAQIDVQGTMDGATTQIFNDREKEHMVDVRTLDSNAMYTRNVCIILGVVLLALGTFLSNKRALRNLAVSYLTSMGVLAAVFAVLGIWAASDFNSFWTSFHQVFFSNNLWLLNPETDTMIRMLPSELFFALIMRIVVLAAAVAVGLALLCIAYLPISKALEKKKKPEVVHEDPLQLDY
jgi:integral membrane protein (TIGR01906 family)